MSEDPTPYNAPPPAQQDPSAIIAELRRDHDRYVKEGWTDLRQSIERRLWKNFELILSLAERAVEARKAVARAQDDLATMSDRLTVATVERDTLRARVRVLEEALSSLVNAADNRDYWEDTFTENESRASRNYEAALVAARALSTPPAEGAPPQPPDPAEDNSRIVPQDWMDEARQIAAQCWCDDETKHIVMDTVLAESVARRIAAWMQTGAQHARNEEFYRGLIHKIGEPFGISAKTSDDGSVQDDILALKVPELVASLRAELDKARVELEAEQFCNQGMKRVARELATERDRWREDARRFALVVMQRIDNTPAELAALAAHRALEESEKGGES